MDETHQPEKREAIGQSEPFLKFQERLSQIAPIDRPVLILGERGTGKELAAKRLHYLSKRWQGELVALNCAALPANLMEAELFGHERGAFTGAGHRRLGRFETAHRGTLFLDEIGTIPMEVQEKILRVVEYGTFERVGSSQSIEVDARLIAATNADLPRMVENGRFKEDLLDRLSFEVLYVPPLRERGEDIEILADHFATKMVLELGRGEIPRFTEDARRELMAYPWPGNIRELKNVVERAVYRSRNDIIDELLFHPFKSQPPPPAATASEEAEEGSLLLEDLIRLPLPEAVWRLKVLMLQNSLHRARHNQKRAARLLGLSYDQFRGIYRKCQRRGDSV